MWAALISSRPAEDPIPVEWLKPHILLDKTRNAVNYSSCTANIADLLGQQLLFRGENCTPPAAVLVVILLHHLLFKSPLYSC